MKELENYSEEKKITDNDIFFKLDDYEDKYIILCRLPGAIKNQISIDYDNDNITIGTFVRNSKESYGAGFYMSFMESKFVEKKFYVPNSDIKKIKGNFDGLNLTIEIGKIFEEKNKDENIIIDIEDYTDI